MLGQIIIKACFIRCCRNAEGVVLGGIGGIGGGAGIPAAASYNRRGAEHAFTAWR